MAIEIQPSLSICHQFCVLRADPSHGAYLLTEEEIHCEILHRKVVLDLYISRYPLIRRYNLLDPGRKTYAHPYSTQGQQSEESEVVA
jgi:hypothetical protein